VIKPGFIYGQQSRQEIIWIAPAEKIPEVAQTTGTVEFLNRVQAFRDQLRGELPHFQILKNDGPNPLT